MVMNNFSGIKQEAVRKLKICIQCKHFNKTTKQCALCSCFMPLKVMIPTMSCPDNPPKW